MEQITVEYFVGRFRKLAASREHQKSFLKSFFEMIVVEDTRRC